MTIQGVDYGRFHRKQNAFSAVAPMRFLIPHLRALIRPALLKIRTAGNSPPACSYFTTQSDKEINDNKRCYEACLGAYTDLTRTLYGPYTDPIRPQPTLYGPYTDSISGPSRPYTDLIRTL